MSFWEDLLVSLVPGIFTTIEIVVLVIPLSIILGIALASIRVYGNRLVSLVVATVVAILRGISLVVTLFIIFFALPQLGIYFSPFWSAVLAITVVSGAYESEYIRGAIQSVGMGQSLAAQALGFNKAKEVIHIILPQALRSALPAISNECIYVILNSSLASYIGVQEMFSISRTVNSLEFRPIEIFLTAGLFYAAMATFSATGLKRLESKLKIPGLEVTR
jgi:polar amino acid transport system permease protein